MNPSALLALISELYEQNAAKGEQLAAAHKEIERLNSAASDASD